MVLFDSKSQNTLYVTKAVCCFLREKKSFGPSTSAIILCKKEFIFLPILSTSWGEKISENQQYLIKNRAFFFSRLYSNETFCFLNVLAEANVVFDLKSKNTLYVTKKEVYFSSCFTNFFGGKTSENQQYLIKNKPRQGGGLQADIQAGIQDLFFSFSSENQRLSTPWRELVSIEK